MARKQDTTVHYLKLIPILVVVLYYLFPIVKFFHAGRHDVLRNIFNFERINNLFPLVQFFFQAGRHDVLRNIFNFQRINNLRTQFLGFTCERLK